MVPKSANARPRLPRITYFHAASRDVLRLYSATRRTDDSAVASRANHITPRLLASTTSNIPELKIGVSSGVGEVRFAGLALILSTGWPCCRPSTQSFPEPNTPGCPAPTPPPSHRRRSPTRPPAASHKWSALRPQA